MLLRVKVRQWLQNIWTEVPGTVVSYTVRGTDARAIVVLETTPPSVKEVYLNELEPTGWRNEIDMFTPERSK